MAREIYQSKGTTKVAFYSNPERYKSVASDLGLEKKKPNGLAEGVRPAKGASGALARLRANLENGKSVLLYCDPTKLGTALKAIRGKKVNGSKVRSTSLPSK